MNKLFTAILTKFFKKYKEEAAVIGARVIPLSNREAKVLLNNITEAQLKPIIEELFYDGVAASNLIMQQDIVKIADKLKMPYKYNKALLDSINGESIFTGFYDNNYKDLYTKKEIDKLKRVILSEKYKGATDIQMRDAILANSKATTKQALLVARLETQRLDGAAVDAYFNDPAVKEKYNKVYHAHDDEKTRPSHWSLNGDIADEDGNFTASDGTKFAYPPNPVSPWNCRCWTTLEKK